MSAIEAAEGRAGFDIHCGDALAVLHTMPGESVNCCITSPPYFGLRDYGCAGQIGLEPTPSAYIARLVDVFREVRRVLRADGTLFVNIGDSYAGSTMTGGNAGYNSSGGEDGFKISRQFVAPKQHTGLKPKDLIGIPWMLAFALRDDGWWLRQDIIWAKPNPMPESVRDRCTKAHEYVFLLTKSARYWWDAEAVQEPFSTDPKENYPARAHTNGHRDQGFAAARGGDRGCSGGYPPGDGPGRNKRSVWTLATQPTPEAHFATFPLELPELCLKAGCPEGGVVLDPFAGAGTTGLACLKNGRRFIGVELNPEYVEIAHNRARKYYPLMIGTVFPPEIIPEPEQLELTA